MRWHLTVVALTSLVILSGCASILITDATSKSAVEQQQDRDTCATAAARAAVEYAWNPLADLAAIRGDQEDECLGRRGYVTTTRISMRPPPAGPHAAAAPFDPVRRCFQQAYAWLDRYDGPLDGRANMAWTAAQQSYLTELQIMSDHLEASQVVRESLLQDLQARGRADEWQACLQDAMAPHS
jgi:uncharacterized protein YceK